MLTDVSTGDFLYLWDTSAGLSYKVYVNDIIGLDATNNDEWFNNIYVRRYARMSGIIGGATGSNLISGLVPGILAGQTNRAVRDYSSILNGVANLTSGTSSLAAGENNEVFGYLASAIGGQLHFLEPEAASIIGGQAGAIYGTQATQSLIGGGTSNIITGNAPKSIILGGNANRLTSAASATIAGGENNKITGNYSFIGGGIRNVSTGIHSVIGGGIDNVIYSEKGVIGGGASNLVTGQHSFIGGGDTNTADGSMCVVVGGGDNISQGIYTFVGGGNSNRIWTDRTLGSASIVGGENNQIIGSYGAILGGDINKVSGVNGIVLGGSANVSSGRYSVTMGLKCEAFQAGAAMFGDSTDVVKRSYGQDSFTLNYSGGAWITGGGLNARRGFNLYPTGVTPTSSIGGRSGDFAYKDDYLYVFTGDNADLSNKNWGRVQLSTLNNTPPSLVSNDSSIVHGSSDNYILTNVFDAVVFGVNSPILSIPAGNNTFEIECVFGAYKGSSAANFLYYYLYNTSDGIKIPNTSGSRSLTAEYNQPTTQFISKTIMVTNYESAKNIQLYAMSNVDGDDARIVSTGSWISYVKLA